jgi:hypothetical protein
MTWPEGVALELVLVGIIWAGVKFCMRGVRSFFDLRWEIRRHMLRFSDQGLWPWDGPRTSPDNGPPTHDQSPEPDAKVFGELGFRMLLLAQDAPLAVRVVKLMGYDPVKAGDNLISLVQEAAPAFRRKSIVDALRLKEGAAEVALNPGVRQLPR